MKEVRVMTIDGDPAQITRLTCDCGCGKRINIGREPFVVDQSSLRIVHADGAMPQDEIVHQPNELNGYFDYYRLECALAGRIPRMVKAEIDAIRGAVQRQITLYGPEIQALVKPAKAASNSATENNASARSVKEEA